MIKGDSQLPLANRKWLANAALSLGTRTTTSFQGARKKKKKKERKIKCRGGSKKQQPKMLGEKNKADSSNINKHKFTQKGDYFFFFFLLSEKNVLSKESEILLFFAPVC
eukprot:TRINITY_DN4988_c0_g1_i1.p1 TRINITY_DN4988_c0_g1~~TRINITY_DN4988_c0_g1_i1.p1  ORF type:complete len:109 (-),score=27.15 TRINITY_DN4988_c0_g1_i1:120-446(-)